MDEFGKVRIDMESIKKKSSADNFVEFVFRQKKEDKGFRADFRHAQSPAQASRAWPYIVPFADIQREIVRTAYVLIGASICWEDAEFNGKCGIGTALGDFHKFGKPVFPLRRQYPKQRREPQHRSDVEAFL